MKTTPIFLSALVTMTGISLISGILGGCAVTALNPPVAAQLKDKLSDDVFAGEFTPPYDSAGQGSQSGDISFRISGTRFRGRWEVANKASAYAVVNGATDTAGALPDDSRAAGFQVYKAKMQGDDKILDCSFEYDQNKHLGEGSCFRSDGLPYYLTVGTRK